VSFSALANPVVCSPVSSYNRELRLSVPKYARVGKRERGNRKHATHNQHDEHRPAQKALPSLNRRFNNLFSSPLHIFLLKI
jgi:hypothetical protein